ncbi:thiolase family protein [Streptosporangium sp. NPDC002607]
MREAVIVDALRTPIARGRTGGALAGLHPVDLLAHVLDALVTRNGFDPALIDDVVAGCVTQAGEQAANIARNAVLAAGLPERVPGTTVDRQCGSSLQAVQFAAQAVMCGAADIVVACGVESMSRAPWGTAAGTLDVYGRRMAGRYPDGLVHQGVAAELVTAHWGLSRTELDEFSAESHRRAAAATARGDFAREILPVPAGGHDEFSVDEGIRSEVSVEALGKLRPAFRTDESAARFPEIDWSITAGNSSQISDGAAGVLIADRETADRLGLRIRAVLRAAVAEGDDPLMMLTAVIPATGKVLARAGLTVDDIDLFEVNEAFAPVVLAWQREIGADQGRVNVNGGAIALGHPLGATGARQLVTLLNALELRGGRFGLQTICEAGGMANALIIERV